RDAKRQAALQSLVHRKLDGVIPAAAGVHQRADTAHPHRLAVEDTDVRPAAPASRERIEIDENQRPLTLAVNEIDARRDRRRKLTLNAEARSVDVRLHTAGIVDRWIEIQLHARLLGDRAQQLTQPSECSDVIRFDEIYEVLPVRACVGN